MFSKLFIVCGHALERWPALVRHPWAEVCTVMDPLSLATIDEVVNQGQPIGIIRRVERVTRWGMYGKPVVNGLPNRARTARGLRNGI